MVYWVPYEQRFLSYLAFSVNEVVRVACLSRSWFVYIPQGDNYATDKPREHALLANDCLTAKR